MNEEKNPEITEVSEVVPENTSKAKSIGREIFEWAYSIVIAVIIAVIKGAKFAHPKGVKSKYEYNSLKLPFVPSSAGRIKFNTAP